MLFSMNGTLLGRETNRAAPQSDTYMAKMLRKPMKVAMSARPLSVSMGGANDSELGGQPLYRSMAEQFASGQMLHLHNELRVAPLNIRAGLVPTSQAIPANS